MLLLAVVMLGSRREVLRGQRVSMDRGGPVWFWQREVQLARPLLRRLLLAVTQQSATFLDFLRYSRTHARAHTYTLALAYDGMSFCVCY